MTDDVSVLGFHSISNRVKNTRKKQGSPRVHLRVPLVPRERDPTGRRITILRWPHPTERNTAARLEIGVESPMFVRTIKRADRGASWCHFPRPLPERDIKGARTAVVVLPWPPLVVRSTSVSATEMEERHDRGPRGGVITGLRSDVRSAKHSRVHTASDSTNEGTLHSQR